MVYHIAISIGFICQKNGFGAPLHICPISGLSWKTSSQNGYSYLCIHIDPKSRFFVFYYGAARLHSV